MKVVLSLLFTSICLFLSHFHKNKDHRKVFGAVEGHFGFSRNASRSWVDDVQSMMIEVERSLKPLVVLRTEVCG